MSTSSGRLGKVRSIFWPIYWWEVRKFLPLLFIYMLICFNYNLLKVAKETLVITAPGSGAEAVLFIKVWVILPMAFFAMYLFMHLLRRYSQETLFYIMIGSFLAFFLLFSCLLYPFRGSIHPHAFADRLQSITPTGMQGFIAILRNWPYVLFYAMAELWGTAVMTVLFWGFANEIMTTGDAKRFYAILGVGANVSAIFAGKVTDVLSKEFFHLSWIFGEDRWGRSLGLVTAVVFLIGFATMVLFRWYHKKFIDRRESANSHGDENRRNDPVKMGMNKNLSFLMRSKYLISIAIIVIAFNVSMSMVEIVWKDQIKEIYPIPNDFMAYLGKTVMITGVLSVVIGIVSGSMIRRIGWTFSAMITPVILSATGACFFVVVLFKDHHFLLHLSTLLGYSSPVALGVTFGYIQHVFSRSCKYTLFDATKEIAFVPLRSDLKLKGKAAIDGIGSRFGKLGGSVIYQGLLMIFGTVTSSIPFVGLFLLFVIVAWIVAVHSLGRQFAFLSAPGIRDVEKAKISAYVEEPVSG